MKQTSYTALIHNKSIDGNILGLVFQPEYININVYL